MKILNLLATGEVGGIEVLCKDIGLYSEDDNTFVFLFKRGAVYDQMRSLGLKLVDLSEYSVPVRMAKLLKLSRQFDIVISHHDSLGLSFFYVFLMFFNHKSRFIKISHSCFDPKYYYPYPDIFRNSLRRFNLKYSLRRSDRLLYVSKAGLASFCEVYDVDRKKAVVVYNGVSDEVLTRGKENHPSFDGELRLLFIGRLEEYKGVHLLLQAIAEVKDEMPVKAVIVGDGAETEALKNTAGELGIETLVSFEGAKLDKQKYYEWANAFVYPSVWKEVFGISVVEGLAYGLPCIANRVGGIPEIVGSGSGILTETSDAAGVAEALRAMYRAYASGALAPMSRNAKETAARFSVRNTVSQLHSIYGEVME